MTAEEAKKAFDELKAQGNTEQDILGVLYLMFQDDKLTVEELGNLAKVLGYDLTDEFLAMSPEDQKTKGWEETEEPKEGVSEEEIEEAKEFGEDEKETETEEKEEDKEDKKENKNEEDEEKEARKLFGFDK